eukprot:Seg2380.2 transcript_id=Seg2380.2/GoldUCD/mRNA.D3Y31 product="hypothetical protein" protein_id=Seg2380.2/GoldUCD/D3Y31
MYDEWRLLGARVEQNGILNQDGSDRLMSKCWTGKQTADGYDVHDSHHGYSPLCENKRWAGLLRILPASTLLKGCNISAWMYDEWRLFGARVEQNGILNQDGSDRLISKCWTGKLTVGYYVVYHLR